MSNRENEHDSGVGRDEGRLSSLLSFWNCTKHETDPGGTGGDTVAQAGFALTHHLENEIPKLLADGRIDEREARKMKVSILNTVSLLEKHKSSIEYVKLDNGVFGADELADVTKQLKVCEFAEKNDMNLDLAYAVNDYMGNREWMENVVGRMVAEQTISKRDADTMMGEVRSAAKRVKLGRAQGEAVQMASFSTG